MRRQFLSCRMTHPSRQRPNPLWLRQRRSFRPNLSFPPNRRRRHCPQHRLRYPRSRSGTKTTPARTVVRGRRLVGYARDSVPAWCVPRAWMWASSKRVPSLCESGPSIFHRSTLQGWRVVFGATLARGRQKIGGFHQPEAEADPVCAYSAASPTASNHLFVSFPWCARASCMRGPLSTPARLDNAPLFTSLDGVSYVPSPSESR